MDRYMLLTSRRFLHRATLTPAVLAFAFLAACVDPAAGPTASTQPLPKKDENVYVASMDSGIEIPALPVEKIPESHRRQVVAYETDQAPGTIIINPKTKLLYYVLGNNRAIRYGIAVGKAGFEWSGEAIVSEKKPWPRWIPPKEMIARKPELAKFDEVGQPGGPTNPLGARAIYLTSGGRDYGYRIHGTPEWQSIGRNASSGCIRMINQDVLDLYARIKGGEKVIVLTASGEMPKGLYIPPPQVPKVAKKPAAAAAPAVIPAGAVPALKVLPPPSIATGSPAVVAPAAATTAPAADPAAPVCKVPLVNGACPAGN
jgi:lipoprotein-anchoring transpeptidase ErfK/SrfK